MANTQEERASSRIYEFARLVAQQDLRSKTLSAARQVSTAVDIVDQLGLDRYVGIGQPSTATHLSQED
jgi:hypothetical protein